MISGIVFMVKFRGRYWTFNYAFESYRTVFHPIYKYHSLPLGDDKTSQELLEELGEKLVTSIPTDPEQYHQWLHTLRDFYSKWDTLLQSFLYISKEQVNTIEHDKSWPAVIEEAFDGNMKNEFPTDKPVRASFHYIAFTIDLDLEVFSIDNSAHYKLGRIPRDRQWIEALCTDHGNQRFVHPHLAPQESLASIAVANQQFRNEDTELWDSLEKKGVPPPKTLEPSSAMALFQLAIFKVVEKVERHQLTTAGLSWTADHLAFRECAFCILCLAAGGDKLSIIDDRRMLVPRDNLKLYSAMIEGEDPKGNREFFSELATGFHLEEHPMGSAPQTSKYWFEGALICLVPRLNEPSVAVKAMADAVDYAKDHCGRASFSAVLISVLDFVLLKRFSDGRVECTRVLPLFNTRGDACNNARQRYNESTLAELLECRQKEPSGRRSAELKWTKEQARHMRSAKWRSRVSFLALVDFFDGLVTKSLTPSNKPALPSEIIELILENVQDVTTFNACRKVSNTFRVLCNKRPLVFDNVIITKLKPGCPTVMRKTEDPIPPVLALWNYLLVDK
ncbi:MAG: hypothetical protein Q9180_002929 [Flavoplaca navasiana]